MASVYHLCYEASDIKQKIVQKYADFAEADKTIYFAAVTIQRTWRGYVVRKMIKRWNEAATTIQRFVRGFLVRWRLPEILKNYYYNLSIKYYNDAATKIQALWRGWHERKYGIDFRALWAYRKQLEQISDDMRAQLRKLFDEARQKALTETQKCILKTLDIMFDRHHLLRTFLREGILSIHGSNELSFIEKILKSLKFKDYMNELNAILHPELKIVNPLNLGHKQFDLNTNIKPKPYEKLFMYQSGDKIS